MRLHKCFGEKLGLVSHTACYVKVCIRQLLGPFSLSCRHVAFGLPSHNAIEVGIERNLMHTLINVSVIKICPVGTTYTEKCKNKVSAVLPSGVHLSPF